MNNQFKNVLKPTFLYSLIALAGTASVFIACSDNEAEMTKTKLITNLSVFESGLKDKAAQHLHARAIQYNEASLKNTKNNYDYEGQSILDRHKSIEDKVNALLPIPGATYEANLKPYINEKASGFTTFSLNSLNADEKILLESFQANFKPSVELMLDYEDFVAANYPDQSKVKRFLTIVSRIKYTIFVTNSDVVSMRTLSGWESCLVQCMRKAFREYNVVDWVEFALNPGGSTLWTAASCGWDCRRSGYYGH